MGNGPEPRRAGTTGHTQVARRGRLWLWALALVLVLMSLGRLSRSPEAAARARPVRIGALTDSWGSTPHMAGLRDGLVALGYREREDFVIGVRFTQGQHARLPAAAHDLVRTGVDLLFVTFATPQRCSLWAIPISRQRLSSHRGESVSCSQVERYVRVCGW
jgi:hypothetical protein